MKRVLTVDEAPRVAAQLRDQGKRIVATNGCFDLLHVGHVRYLEAAHSLGDVLIVGLNGDASVRALKGEGRPLNNENDRAEVLASVRWVDYVVIFPDVRATSFLESVRPAIYVKGGDYKEETLNREERTALQRMGTQIRIIPFEQGYSTSGLLARMNSA